MPNPENERIAIRNLQRYLRQLSYHNPSIPAPPIDGIFERDTEASLRAFQNTRDLPVTGIADPVTWQELYALYRASLSENAPPREIALFPFTDTPAVMIPGTDGFAVAALQHMLRELSEHYAELDAVEVNGIYDDTTVQAVTFFQSRNALPQTGNTDVATWNTVADQYNIRFAVDPFL